MDKDFTISYYFDKRYINKENQHNLRLTVYNKNIAEASKRRKVYSTPFWFTDKEWEEISNFSEQKSGKKSKDYLASESKILPIIKQMEGYLSDVISKAESLEVFSFSAFEKALSKPTFVHGNSVTDYYNKAIQDFTDNEQVGTASNYDSSLKSILKYREAKNFPKDFYFIEITNDWLKDYERWMNKEEKSNATIGIYLRPLRALFNTAIANKIISATQYPFHNKENKEGYKIPASGKVKKALSSDDLKKLFSATDLTMEEEKAKDFFFFSYLSNGMNIKDIALLKWQNISEHEFSFIRAKTAKTTIEKQTPIIVSILDYHKEIFRKYGSLNIKGNFVFSIVNKKMNATEMKQSINAFTRFVNQHIKKVAEKNNITSEISTYWARHSFASQLMNENTSTEFIKQALGHNSIATTNSYLSAFSTEIKEQKAKNLYDKLK